MNNKEKIRDVIIGILVTIIILLVSFIILIKLDIISFNSKKEVKENNSIKVDTKEEEKITLEEVNELIDKYTKALMFVNIFKTNDLSDEIKDLISFTNLSDNDFKKIDCQGYDEELVYDSNIQGYRNSEYLVCGGAYFDYSTINKIYHDLFGNSNDFSKKDFNFSLNKYKYLGKTDTFEQYYILGGIEGSKVYIYSVIEQKIMDNNLIVTVGYVEYEDVSLTGEYISNIDGMPKYTEDEMSKSNYSKIINDNIDLVEKYELTFVKEEGMYKLNKIEKR